MKHLLKIISSLTILSTGVLAVSCTNKVDNNKVNKENRDNKDAKNEDPENMSQDDPNVLPKIEITEEEKKAATDTLQKVFKQQEDAFGSFHTYQDVVDQLKVYLGDYNVKHLEYLKLSNESERNTNLSVDSEHKKINNIKMSYFDKQVIFTPNTVLKDKVETKYNENKNEIIQLGYEFQPNIKNIKVTKVNKNTIKVPLHLPLKVNSLDESFKDIETNKIDNLNRWNTKNIKFLTKTFENATKFNQSLDSWNVSNVIDMTEAFAGATSFNQSLNSWDISNVKIMKGIFWDAENFDGDISNWNTKNVEDMEVMFSGAKKFNQDLSRWDVSKVENMKGMFSKTDTFNSNISNWNTQKVASMEQMFENAKAFNQDLTNWNVKKVNHAEKFANGGEKNFTEKHQPKFESHTAK
ncbi:BspA family leucine-rich repeat surface protein [Mycoplasma feriruminatoris]|uniref:BspA family leucine-rich repeat surface protein n=1 Tax=Mycoplasma feriruminatoris TaxID=1179777 RepID=A0AAQ3DMP3_9MOLU|nr:BspA family leucine-rich repeat surface protein [Mycoplasma feriruminatoris]WFQ94943.1 BspA family leucine-rich repeat surface protein [Mycoplasma feriruminatoris]